MTVDSSTCDPRVAGSFAEGRRAPKVRFRRTVTGGAKAFAWQICGAGVVVWRLWATVLGRRQDVDVVIYKVDRLGDWLLAGPSIERIIADGKSRGAAVVLWAADESALLRRWREPTGMVESFALEPSGIVAKVRRAWRVMRLLATYRARSFLCLRYAPEPIRDFVLRSVDAKEIRAFSWVITGEAPGDVPHEICRHRAMLAGVGLAPNDPRDLLPLLPGRLRGQGGVVIVAPFSSATIKDWSDAAWVEVAGWMAARGFSLEFWVGPGQLARAEALAARISGSHPHSRIAVRTGALGELGAAIAASVLVLSVDTFAAHLAVAMDVPLVCVIGGGQFGDFGPWSRSARQRWVSNRIPCFGCDWRCSRPSVDCMLGISSETVIAEAGEALLRDAGVSVLT